MAQAEKLDQEVHAKSKLPWDVHCRWGAGLQRAQGCKWGAGLQVGNRTAGGEQVGRRATGVAGLQGGAGLQGVQWRHRTAGGTGWAWTCLRGSGGGSSGLEWRWEEGTGVMLHVWESRVCLASSVGYTGWLT